MGEPVITEGVVTAAYPTGGFNGFYLQTAGTGGGTDATPGASDAVFVYRLARPRRRCTIGDFVEVQGDGQRVRRAPPRSASPPTDVTTRCTTPSSRVTPRGRSPTRRPTPRRRRTRASCSRRPTDFTVTDNFDTNYYGEFGLATGDHQLVQPTDVANPTTDTAGVAAVQADNARRRSRSTTASSTNFLSTANKGIPLPWLTHRQPGPDRLRGDLARAGDPRVPQQPVGPPADHAGDRRRRRRRDVRRHPRRQPGAAARRRRPPAGDVQRARTSSPPRRGLRPPSAPGNACTSFNDRDGNPDHRQPVLRPTAAAAGAWDADRTCSASWPRRSRRSTASTPTCVAGGDRELRAVRQGPRRRAGAAGRRAQRRRRHDPWAYAPSPDRGRPAADRRAGRHPHGVHLQPGQGRAGRRLRRARRPVRPGRPFANAREPLAQEFKRKGALDSDGFLVVVNHFKSKGDSTPPATGDNANGIQGAFNGDRVRQAHALVDFATRSRPTAARRRSSWWVTSTPTPRRTRCRCSTTTGYVNQRQRRPARRQLRVRRHRRLARPRARQPGGRGDGDRPRRLADQRRGVRRVRVQPLQLQRRRSLPAQPVPRLRPRPGARRPGRAVLPSRRSTVVGDRDARPDQEEEGHHADRRHGPGAQAHADRRGRRSWSTASSSPCGSSSTATPSATVGPFPRAGTRPSTGALPR